MIAVLLPAYGVLYLLWFGFRWGGPDLEVAINDSAMLPIGIAAIATALWASWRQPSLGARLAWLTFAAAFAAYVCGDAAWLWIEVLRGEEVPFPSIADAGYLAFYPLMLGGLLLLPRERPESTSRWGLDLAIVMVGTGTVVWWLVISPVAAVQESGAAEAAVALAYPVGDLLVAFALGAALLRHLRETSRAALGLLAAGVSLNVVADLAYARLTLEASYESAGWLDAAYLIGWVTMALAGVAQVAAGGGASGVDRRPTKPISSLPYLAVAGVYALLAVATAADPVDVQALVAGAITVTALVVVRQFMTARENAVLLAERASSRTEARFGAIIRNASDVIAVVDAAGSLRYITPSAVSVLGQQPGDLVGGSVARLVTAHDAPRLLGLVESASGRAGLVGPVICHAGPQRDSAVEITVSNLLDDPLVAGLVVTLRDVTERLRFEAQLRSQALRDPLTGLANRVLLTDRIEQALRRAARRRSSPALLYVDLDDFKEVNDTLGHVAGDEVLVEVARRLRQTVRGEDTPVRLGGDEFAILIEETSSVADATRVAERVLEALAQPIETQGTSLAISGSIGIVRAEPRRDEGVDLLRDADIAMYVAKRNARGSYQVFAPEMYAETVERVRLEAELRGALDRRELSLVYQPLIGLDDGQLLGVEALLRWRHPALGPIPPATFIPVAEASGEIRRIGRWVLEEACRQAASWNRSGTTELRMNVNVSVRQLEPGFLEQVQEVLAATGLDPRLLVLEITETAFAGGRPDVVAILAGLRGLGLRIAIDDFGTGYSALGYLRDLPIDELKIDRSFVERLSGTGDGSLVATILQLGRELSVATVAEGIELEVQLAALRKLGCTVGQGFLLGTPAPPAELGPTVRGTSSALAATA